MKAVTLRNLPSEVAHTVQRQAKHVADALSRRGRTTLGQDRDTVQDRLVAGSIDQTPPRSECSGSVAPGDKVDRELAGDLLSD